MMLITFLPYTVSRHDSRKKEKKDQSGSGADL